MILDVQTWRIHAFAIAGSLVFLAFILLLIKRRRLREEYSLLWLASAVAIGLVAAWRDGLVVLAKALGVAYAPAALFIVLLGAITTLLLHFSVVTSQHRSEIRILTQELALLRCEFEQQTRAAGAPASPRRADPTS